MRLFKCPEDNGKIGKIMECIEYTALLNINSTQADVKRSCEDAIRYKMGRIVPLQMYLPYVMEFLKGSSVKVVQGSTTDVYTKAEHLNLVEQGIKLGCCEIDMLSRLPLFFDKKYDEFQEEVHEVYKLTSGYHIPLKLIIETGYLTDEEKILISRLGLDAGATFIKTCTGMRKGRGTLHDILLLKDAFGERIKIKASGGIASLEDAYTMLQAGADRVAIRGLAVKQLRELGYVAA
ncbi:MAG: deoxyribose-phosphate aldolase [Spirochaetales bacterium]|nr:deoxyribose-phosphate aldolase [Spirochaetales bacterium]